MDDFLLVVAWSDAPDMVRLMPCRGPVDATAKLQTMIPFSPHDLQVVAFVAMENAHDFADEWSESSKGWRRLSLAMKQCLLDDYEDLRPQLSPIVTFEKISDWLRWPELSLTHTERRQLNVEAGRLPRFVQSAEDYVLWAVAEVNCKRSFCCSRDLVGHPANKELYSKSTIYNVLASFKKNGLVREDTVAASKVFSLTPDGERRLRQAEEACQEERQRKSAKSLYGALQ
jgi:hypothetical protein